MWSNRPYTFDRVVRIFFSAALLGVVIYLMYVLRDVLLPFCVACLLAYIIEPWVEFNRRILKLKGNTMAVVITCIEGLVVIVGISLIIVPVIEKECAQLAIILDKYVRQGHYELARFPETFHRFFREYLDIDKIIEQLQNVNTAGALKKLWDTITSGLDKILGVLGWAIVFVYVIFILIDFDRYRNGIMNLIPDRYIPFFQSISHDLSGSMKRYFRNQALISVITGLCYTVGFSIVGIPMAVVIGLVNIILFMVPYLVYVSLIPVTLMCFFKSMETGVDFWTIWLECLCVYAFVEAFSDLILTPRIMGKAMGLNPAMIFLSLSVWGTLLGLLGMVIALPATTILSRWAKLWLIEQRDRSNASFRAQKPPS